MAQKTKILFFFFLVLIFLGIAFPFGQTEAVFGLENLAGNIVALPIKLFISVSRIFLTISSSILSWVLGEDFITWGYTRNPFVNEGWRLTRDITNMFFVIILAFIGLATALKLEQYRYQKLVPKLIGIALIINFSPVICGVIVDASNILMNFFLEQYTSGSSAGITIKISNKLAEQFRDVNENFDLGGDVIQKAGRIIQAFMIMIFNIWTSFLFLLFSFLFAGRYIAIWTLVILSPFAFFSPIVPLPQVQGLWKTWWSQFFQWCFIGVTASFYLYLGDYLISEIGPMITSSPPSGGGLEDYLGAAIQNLVPYGFAIGFLSVGFLGALKSSVVGANYAIRGSEKIRGLAKGAAGWAGAKMGAAALGSAGWLKKQTLTRAATGAKTREFLGAMGRRAGAGPWKDLSGREKAGRVVGETFGRVAPWVVRAGLQYSTQQAQRVTNRKEEIEKQFGGDWGNAAAAINTFGIFDYEGRIAGLQYLAEKGGATALKQLPQGYFEDGVKKMKTYASYLIPGMVKHKPETIVNDKGQFTAFGESIQKNLVEEDNVKELITLGYEATEARARAAMKKIIDLVSLTPSDIDKMMDSSFENEMFMDAIALHGSPALQKRIYDQRSSDVSENLTKALEERVGGARLYQANPSSARRAVYGPFMSGMVDIEGLKTKQDYESLSQSSRLDVGGLEAEVANQRNALSGITEAQEIEEAEARLKVLENYLKIKQKEAEQAVPKEEQEVRGANERIRRLREINESLNQLTGRLADEQKQEKKKLIKEKKELEKESREASKRLEQAQREARAAGPRGRPGIGPRPAEPTRPSKPPRGRAPYGQTPTPIPLPPTMTQRIEEIEESLGELKGRLTPEQKQEKKKLLRERRVLEKAERKKERASKPRGRPGVGPRSQPPRGRAG